MNMQRWRSLISPLNPTSHLYSFLAVRTRHWLSSLRSICLVDKYFNLCNYSLLTENLLKLYRVVACYGNCLPMASRYVNFILI